MESICDAQDGDMGTVFRQARRKGEEQKSNLHLSSPLERTGNLQFNLKEGALQSKLSKCTDSKSTEGLLDLQCFLESIQLN